MGKRFNWYQRLLFITGFAFLAAVTIYVVSVYGRIDPEIPTHYNASGAADAFGGKASLIGQLAVGWGLYIILAVVGHVPAIWNMGSRERKENRDKAESISRTMLSVLIFVLPAFFSYTVFCTARGVRLHAAALPVFMIAVFGTIIVTFVRLYKIR